MGVSKVFVRGAHIASAAFALVAGSVFGQSVPAPEIELLGQGSYVVSYARCAECAADGLEEFRATTGSWEHVGTGPVTVTNRPPGTYRYRVVYIVAGRFTAMAAYGPAESVVVGASAPAPALSAQFDAQYTIRSGDVDGDGRRDLMIRSAGMPADAAGMIGDVLLRRAGASFSAEIPGSGALAVAAGWPESPVEIRKRDVNIDGYVDLVLRGLDSAVGFTGVPNQILFAPGSTGSGAAPRLRAVDDALSRFSRDVNRHLIDPEYYPNNATINYAVSYYYVLNCGSLGYYGIDRLEAWYDWPCYVEPVVSYVAYRDYSGFDADAIRIASIDYGMIKGSESLEAGLESIAAVVARVLGIAVGGWEIEDLVGGDAIESEEEERGVELFAVLAGISEAVAQEREQDPEGEQGAGSANADRVLLKGRRVLGQGPFHTALEYRYSTVSAYDSDPRALFDGRLVSEVNWPRDHPSLTLRMGYVDGPVAPILYWSRILAADARYDDDLRYDLFPSLGQGGYNSNSFVSGLILATLGRSTVEMTTFVGGERPVPGSAFN